MTYVHASPKLQVSSSADFYDSELGRAVTAWQDADKRRQQRYYKQRCEEMKALADNEEKPLQLRKANTPSEGEVEQETDQEEKFPLLPLEEQPPAFKKLKTQKVYTGSYRPEYKARYPALWALLNENRTVGDPLDAAVEVAPIEQPLQQQTARPAMEPALRHVLCSRIDPCSMPGCLCTRQAGWGGGWNRGVNLIPFGPVEPPMDAREPESEGEGASSSEEY